MLNIFFRIKKYIYVIYYKYIYTLLGGICAEESGRNLVQRNLYQKVAISY